MRAGLKHLRQSASNLELETFNSQSGITLVEMMVTVTLLVVIILGLVAMFDQTRKAFTSGIVNIDYQDSARATLDLMSRDLEQMAPGKSGVLFSTSAFPGNDFTNNINFYTDIDPSLTTKYIKWPTPAGDLITNSLDRLLFVTRYNQGWSAVGYRIDPVGASQGLGTLYQYRATGPVTNPGALSGPLLADFFSNTNQPPLNRVIDNVVSFRIRAYDPNGLLITNNRPDRPNILLSTNAVMSVATGDYQYAFASNAIPAYVELELGILETRTAERYRSMGGINAQTFLTNHTGQVHIYHQRVTIPGVDRTAYP